MIFESIRLENGNSAGTPLQYMQNSFFLPLSAANCLKLQRCSYFVGQSLNSLNETGIHLFKTRQHSLQDAQRLFEVELFKLVHLLQAFQRIIKVANTKAIFTDIITAQTIQFALSNGDSPPQIAKTLSFLTQTKHQAHWATPFAASFHALLIFCRPRHHSSGEQEPKVLQPSRRHVDSHTAAIGSALTRLSGKATVREVSFCFVSYWLADTPLNCGCYECKKTLWPASPTGSIPFFRAGTKQSHHLVWNDTKTELWVESEWRSAKRRAPASPSKS